MKRHHRLRLFPFFCTLLFLAIACVPTPETEFVVNKGDDALVQILAENGEGFSMEDYRASLPQRWTESVPTGTESVSLTVDATVLLPETDRMPSLEVAACGVDLDAVRILIEQIHPGAVVARIPVDEWGTAARTKEMLLAEVEQNNDRITHAAELYAGESPEEIAGYCQYLEEANAELMKEYETAPADAHTPVDLETLREEHVQSEFGLYDKSDRRVAELTLIFDADGRREQFHYRAGQTGTNTFAYDKEAALSEANRFLEAMGYADAYRASVSAEHKTIIGIACRRTVNGVDVLPFYDRQWDGTWDSFEPEELLDMTFRLEDGALETVSWCGNCRIVREVIENTQLLPFDHVQERIENALRALFTWTNETISKRDIVVQQVRLGYCRVKVPNEENRMLVPTWQIIGTITDSGSVWDPDSETAIPFANTVTDTLLLINAVDGTTIQSAITDE